MHNNEYLGCNHHETPCEAGDCGCKVLLNSDCVSDVSVDLTCSNILKGQTLSEVLVQLDQYICERFTSVENFIKLVNVGTGAKIYKGASSLGKKELRTLLDSSLINLTEGTEDITISVDEIALNTFIEANQIVYSALNVGTGAGVYKSVTVLGDSNQLNLRKIKSSNSSVSIIEGTDDIDITVSASVIPDGSETKVTAGTNVAVSGTGTATTPYVISSTDTNTTYSAGTAISLVGTTFNNTAPDQTVVLTQGGATTITGTYPNFIISSTDTNTVADGSETKINQGSNVTISGVGTTASPYVINATSNSTTADGSETKINSGTTTAVTGVGTTVSPYVIETVNLQKVITYPTNFTGVNYTLTDADSNYEIIVDNSTTAVTITVPVSLKSKIGIGFTQKGTGDVSYIASGTTINNPTGLKIKGQFYQTFLSQEGVTNNYFLGGNTKA